MSEFLCFYVSSYKKEKNENCSKTLPIDDMNRLFNRRYRFYTFLISLSFKIQSNQFLSIDHKRLYCNERWTTGSIENIRFVTKEALIKIFLNRAQRSVVVRAKQNHSIGRNCFTAIE